MSPATYKLKVTIGSMNIHTNFLGFSFSLGFYCQQDNDDDVNVDGMKIERYKLWKNTQNSG